MPLLGGAGMLARWLELLLAARSVRRSFSAAVAAGTPSRLVARRRRRVCDRRRSSHLGPTAVLAAHRESALGRSPLTGFEVRDPRMGKFGKSGRSVWGETDGVESASP